MSALLPKLKRSGAIGLDDDVPAVAPLADVALHGSQRSVLIELPLTTSPEPRLPEFYIINEYSLRVGTCHPQGALGANPPRVWGIVPCWFVQNLLMRIAQIPIRRCQPNMDHSRLGSWREITLRRPGG